MCQAWPAERRFVMRLEKKNGRCKLGHLRWRDGICTVGALCPTNDHKFGDFKRSNNKFRKENEEKLLRINIKERLETR